MPIKLNQFGTKLQGLQIINIMANGEKIQISVIALFNRYIRLCLYQSGIGFSLQVHSHQMAY